MSPGRTFHSADDSAGHKSRRVLRYVEETWVEAGAASPYAAATSEAATGTGSSDDDVLDSGGYDADVELGGASFSSSSSSHCASTSDLLSTSNDASAGEIIQLKRRRYVEEIWFEAGASSSTGRRGIVVHGGGKRRLVAVDEGNPNRELPVGAVKHFHRGWYGVLVSIRPISATEASTEEAIDSGGYDADAESGASSSSAEADEEEVESSGRVDIVGR